MNSFTDKDKQYREFKQRLNVDFFQKIKLNVPQEAFEMLMAGQKLKLGHLFMQEIIDQGLLEACQRGALESARYLLASNDLKVHQLPWANINKYDDEPFILACKSGNVKLVQYLIGSEDLRGRSWSKADVQNQRGAREACLKGHVEVLKLLTSGDKEELKLRSWSGEFIEACYQGYSEVVKYCLSNEFMERGNKEVEDEEKVRGFHAAVQNGKVEVLRVFMEAWENKDIKAKDKGNENNEGIKKEGLFEKIIEDGINDALERGCNEVLRFLIVDKKRWPSKRALKRWAKDDCIPKESLNEVMEWCRARDEKGALEEILKENGTRSIGKIKRL